MDSNTLCLNIENNRVHNDHFRWGEDCRAKNGGYWTHADRFDPGEVQEHKFENAMTIDKTWGYRKDIRLDKIKTPEYMIEQIARTGKHNVQCFFSFLCKCVNFTFIKILKNSH